MKAKLAVLFIVLLLVFSVTAGVGLCKMVKLPSEIPIENEVDPKLLNRDTQIDVLSRTFQYFNLVTGRPDYFTIYWYIYKYPFPINQVHVFAKEMSTGEIWLDAWRYIKDGEIFVFQRAKKQPKDMIVYERRIVKPENVESVKRDFARFKNPI